MGFRNIKVTEAAMASVLVVAWMAAVAAAADNQDVAKFEIDKFCGATGFKETCIKSIGSANSTKPKDLIKAAFDSTVLEIESAIKNTSLYKKTASDKWEQGALEVCEEVLERSIDEIRRSLDNVNSFEIGKVDHALDDAKIWLTAADTYRSTCLDAFAKTKGNTRDEVTKTLKTTGELMSNAIAMVIEFEKIVKSVDFGAIIKQRQLLRVDEEEVSHHRSRKLQGGAPTMNLPPRVTVAQDGSGQFKTIQDAVKSVPVGNKDPFVILVKAGTYYEYVEIPPKVDHVVLVGEGPLKTRISGKRSYTGGFQTFYSATLTVNGQSFTAKDIGIENTAGPDGHQAVTLRISGDLGVFYNVHLDGYQDTLYPHVNRQFFRECRVSGTVDFIFGNAIVVFQKCNLVVRKPGPKQQCMVTAQGREATNRTGVTVVQGCTITAEQDFLTANPPFDAFLGRPWKKLSRTVIMQSIIDKFISPLGWHPWKGNTGLDSCEYYEYRNKGDGANTTNRVTWKGIKHFADDNEAILFTAARQFQHDEWVRETGVPYDPVFMNDDDIKPVSPAAPATPNPNPLPTTPNPNPNPNPAPTKKHISHKKK